jgi:hypothetical protein
MRRIGVAVLAACEPLDDVVHLARMSVNGIEDRLQDFVGIGI